MYPHNLHKYTILNPSKKPKKQVAAAVFLQSWIHYLCVVMFCYYCVYYFYTWFAQQITRHINAPCGFHIACGKYVVGSCKHLYMCLFYILVWNTACKNYHHFTNTIEILQLQQNSTSGNCNFQKWSIKIVYDYCKRISNWYTIYVSVLFVHARDKVSPPWAK